MNQFNKLCTYLDKLGIPYEKYTFNKDKFFKGLTSVSVPYKDDNGYEARIQADKSITVRKETHGIKDYVVANLYYIELEDGFVDPNDCSPKKELFVMDAWEAARYIGAEYFGKDPEDIEPMLESKSKKKCSMQKKMESLGKKNERSVRHFTNRIESLAEQEFVDMAAIGEYMLTAFSEDKIEQAYDWMERDEMIPTEDALEENGIEFSDTDTRKYTNRIIDLVDMEYLTYKEIGEYLLRAFSEDDIEKLYGWLEQDEMIPSEEELRDEYEVEFDYDGELVSAEKEEACKKEATEWRDFSLKELKDWARDPNIEDISDYTFSKAKALKDLHRIEVIGVSTGTYGINGGAFEDENGNKYVSTKRGSALSYLVG